MAAPISIDNHATHFFVILLDFGWVINMLFPLAFFHIPNIHTSDLSYPLQAAPSVDTTDLGMDIGNMEKC